MRIYNTYTSIYIVHIVQILMKYTSPSTTLKEEAKAAHKKHFLVTFHPPPRPLPLLVSSRCTPAQSPATTFRSLLVPWMRKPWPKWWAPQPRGSPVRCLHVSWALWASFRRFHDPEVIRCHEFCCGIQLLMLKCMVILRDFPRKFSALFGLLSYNEPCDLGPDL